LKGLAKLGLKFTADDLLRRLTFLTSTVLQLIILVVVSFLLDVDIEIGAVDCENDGFAL